MALADNWQDLQDAVAGVPDSGSKITVAPINKIAHAVIAIENKGTKITVDSELDVNSENPVQNKVVTTTLNNVNKKINEIKTEIGVYGDVAFISDVILPNTELYYGIISDFIAAGVSDFVEGSISALHFSTPNSLPSDYSTFPEEYIFKGDSVEDENFVPEANMRYTIVFDYDGANVIGYVSGVSL